VANGGSYVGQDAIFHLGGFVFAYVHKRNRIQRVGRVGGTIRIGSVVCVAVVGNDDDVVTVLLAGFDHFGQTGINRFDSCLDG